MNEFFKINIINENIIGYVFGWWRINRIKIESKLNQNWIKIESKLNQNRIKSHHKSSKKKNFRTCKKQKKNSHTINFLKYNYEFDCSTLKTTTSRCCRGQYWRWQSELFQCAHSKFIFSFLCAKLFRLHLHFNFCNRVLLSSVLHNCRHIDQRRVSLASQFQQIRFVALIVLFSQPLPRVSKTTQFLVFPFWRCFFSLQYKVSGRLLSWSSSVCLAHTTLATCRGL